MESIQIQLLLAIVLAFAIGTFAYVARYAGKAPNAPFIVPIRRRYNPAFE